MKSISFFIGATALSVIVWNLASEPKAIDLAPSPHTGQISPAANETSSGETQNQAVLTEIPRHQHHHECESCGQGSPKKNPLSQIIATKRSESWPKSALDHLQKQFKVSQKSTRHLSRAISYTEFEQLNEEQLERVVNYASWVQDKKPRDLLHLCWATNTAPALRNAMDQVRALAIEEGSSDEPQQAFQGDDRWFRTATDGFVAPTGSPVTITWGFVADGTPISSASGFSAGTSNLIATLNATYGSSPTSSYEDAPWFELFETAFAYWSQVTGNIYVYVDYDNGVEINGSSTGRGILGTRPDVRIGGKTLDGNGGTLAYNYFPDGGDMVIDTNDSSNFSNNNTTKTRFRNVVAHEHGHGLGMSHVCPINRTKLMEPSVTTQFAGVQFDDMLTGQGLYGDLLERSGGSTNNNTTGNAYDLGTVSDNLQRQQLSISITGDVDYYTFNVTSSKLLNLRLIPTTQAAYLEGPQSGSSCSSGTSFNPNTRQNLSVRILAPNGTTELANANSQPIGSEENINNLLLSQSGQNYYIEVTGGGENSSSDNNAQVYSLVLDVSDPLPTVSVSTSDALALEENVSDTGEFTVTSSIAPSSNLSVAYTVSGTATSGSDFQALAGTATINLGQLETTIPVTAISDSAIEGDETVTVTLTPSANYTLGTNSAELTIKDLPFDDWRFNFFGGNTLNIGESEDYEFDGIRNLIEYALGLNPTIPNPQIPTASLQNNGTELVLSFEENTNLTDIQYIVEVSPTLGGNPTPWTTTGVTLTNGPLVDGKRTVTARASVSGARQFMRLRVVRN